MERKKEGREEGRKNGRDEVGEFDPEGEVKTNSIKSKPDPMNVMTVSE
jgi:predicted transposase YdaD